MRASDDLRERTVSRLGAGYAQGLLSFDTLCLRVERAYGARTVEQLRALVGDLPDAGGALRRMRAWLVSATGAQQSVGCADALLSPPPDLDDREFVLGREPDCDLVVEDPTVSRRHARLTFDRESGRWSIADLGSLNGTWVEGWRVQGPATVEPGDAVRLGSAGWVFAPRG